MQNNFSVDDMLEIFKREEGRKNTNNMNAFVSDEKAVQDGIVSKLERADDRLQMKRRQIEDAFNEYALLRTQTMQTYATELAYANRFLCRHTMLQGAMAWIEMLKNGVDSEGHKIDKRVKYAEKKQYELLCHTLSNIFTVENVHVVSGGRIGELGTEGYTFGFECERGSYEIWIPFATKVSLTRYLALGADAYKITVVKKEANNKYKMICKTFFENELTLNVEG